jgi:hypothetical protein
LSAVIAEKLRLKDEALSCGTAALGELGAVGVLELDELVLPQAAAIRAALAAAAVRAIVLLLIKPNETTSFMIDVHEQMRHRQPDLL